MSRIINLPKFIELISSNLSDQDKLSFISCNKFLLKFDNMYDYDKIKNNWRLRCIYIYIYILIIYH